jgi:hypothetical protein
MDGFRFKVRWGNLGSLRFFGYKKVYVRNLPSMTEGNGTEKIDVLIDQVGRFTEGLTEIKG